MATRRSTLSPLAQCFPFDFIVIPFSRDDQIYNGFNLAGFRLFIPRPMYAHATWRITTAKSWPVPKVLHLNIHMRPFGEHPCGGIQSFRLLFMRFGLEVILYIFYRIFCCFMFILVDNISANIRFLAHF